MSRLRPRAGALVALGTSALAGAAYRYTSSASSAGSAEPLNPHTFSPYTLVSKTPVSSTSAIFTLRPRNGAAADASASTVDELWKRSVWSVQIKQPQLQIARAYTPLPPSPQPPKQHATETDAASAAAAAELQDERGDIRLLIRRETGGEVSTYLHRLPPHSTIELRGPNVEAELPHDVRDVVFLAGGTGIAPAVQVAQAMGRRTGGRMCVLWASRRREECVGGVSDGVFRGEKARRKGWWGSLVGGAEEQQQQQQEQGLEEGEKGVLVKELEALKGRGETQTRGLSVGYYVDEEGSRIEPGDVVRALGVHDAAEEKKKKGSKVIMVSGPDGFIEYWAGRKLWVDGREVQGPLGGVLGKMDLKGWSVVKL
ncbi:hypothetical protein BS50DRAFT_266126 [Corynespora cassiicola Philippines]|uniref:FAD-binding FR-type domain-containing protein n=1 Tax=Corynespora cassiicola Philippines TaxID=1448308 RepID=A0A2T2NZ21_CORCC|nr:hypothetical protein BS50DRAFT_266126 [Corynespora cassiicola Philippines]